MFTNSLSLQESIAFENRLAELNAQTTTPAIVQEISTIETFLDEHRVTSSNPDWDEFYDMVDSGWFL